MRFRDYRRFTKYLPQATTASGKYLKDRRFRWMMLQPHCARFKRHPGFIHFDTILFKIKDYSKCYSIGELLNP